MPNILGQPEVRGRHLESSEHVTRPELSASLRLTTPTWERVDPHWWLVEATVEACLGKTDDGIATYCVLSWINRNQYVQAAFAPECGVAWRLEWRITDIAGSYAHYFAHAPGETDGTVVHDIVHVVTAFKAFYMGRGMPDTLVWVPLDI
jgi:hypothetical protein